MHSPGCKCSAWEYSHIAIVRCKTCGYLLPPFVFGALSNIGNTGLDRSEISLYLAENC